MALTLTWHNRNIAVLFSILNSMSTSTFADGWLAGHLLYFLTKEND